MGRIRTYRGDKRRNWCDFYYVFAGIAHVCVVGNRTATSLCNTTGLARPCEHSKMPAGIYVNSNFDGGNMDVIDIKPDGHIQLAIQEVLTPNFQLHLPNQSIRHVS